MKIKANKKHRLIVEYDFDKIKFSYCRDILADKASYSSTSITKENICLNDLNILVRELDVNIAASDILIFLSRSLFINRYLTLPTVDSDEINNMLRYQLPKLIPYSMDEIIYDYKVINRVDHKSIILVLLLQKQKLDLLNDFLINNKAIAQYTGLVSELLVNAYELSAELDEAKFILYKYTDRAEFIYYDETIKFMRCFKYKEEKSFEINIEQTRDLLEKELGKVKVDDLTVVDEIKDLYSNIADFEFAYDFSSLATQRLQRKRMVRNYAINFAVVALQIFIVCFLFSYKSNLLSVRKISILKNEVKRIKSELGDSTIVLDKLATLETLQGNRGIFSVLLYDLVSLLPSLTVISSLDIEENNKFTVKGFAPNMETIFKYVTQLNSKKAFAQVSAQNVSKVRQKNSNRVEFSIDGKWLDLTGGESD